jgi:hypothetical protein
MWAKEESNRGGEEMSFQNGNARESALRLPDLTQITCLADGHPLPGAWVKLIVTVAHKNNFSVIAGPADTDGAIWVTREEILKSGEQDVTAFPMDYSHPEKDWTGSLLIEVMNSSGVDLARRAHELNGSRWEATSLVEPFLDRLDSRARLLHPTPPPR